MTVMDDGERSAEQGGSGVPQEAGKNGDGRPTTPDRESQRLEYSEAGEHLRAGVTVIWDAFKTYFTVAALLFAAFAYLAWGEGSKQLRFSKPALTVIAGAGLSITILAGFAIRRIVTYLDRILHSASRAEEALSQAGDDGLTGKSPPSPPLLLVRNIRAVWNSGHMTAPYMTYLVLGVFGLGWVACAVYALFVYDLSTLPPAAPINSGAPSASTPSINVPSIGSGVPQ